MPISSWSIPLLIFCSWKGLASRSLKGLVALMVMIRQLSGIDRRSWKTFYSPIVDFCLKFLFWGKGSRNLIFFFGFDSYPSHAKANCMPICSYESVSFVTTHRVNQSNAFDAHLNCWNMKCHIISEGSKDVFTRTLVGFRFSNFTISICCLFCKLQCLPGSLWSTMRHCMHI